MSALRGYGPIAGGDRAARRPASGVSLIEALVAMAVMGFGMLGLAGLQTSLRTNSDVSKQRSEAVRIAQAAIETNRSFSVLSVAPNRWAYDQIVAAAQPNVVPANSNTSFAVQTLVTDYPAVGDELFVAPHKRLIVDVSWRDRNNLDQSLRLGTFVTAQAPELTAALSTPADASVAQQFGGRHPAVPVGALDLGNGTSQFSPPGAPGGLTWTFNNVTAFITQACVGGVCTAVNARLLTGYVRFATAPAPAPTGADAEVPPSGIPISGGQTYGVQVVTTGPAAQTVGCFEASDFVTASVNYFCAVPIVAPDVSWSGRANLVRPGGLPRFANNVNDARSNRNRVCRYTIAAARVFPQLSVATVPQPIRNEEHPLDYLEVKTALTNQNFLVIRAGDGTDPYDCPADDPATPYVNGSTWHHQPPA